MARPPWVKSDKNDRVFLSLRKRKDFEIFSTCSDGGDIEAADVACREADMARPPWVKSGKNDRVFLSLRKRKNFEIFSICSDRGDISGGNGPCGMRACWARHTTKVVQTIRRLPPSAGIRTTILAYLSHSEAPLVLTRAQFSLRTALH